MITYDWNCEIVDIYPQYGGHDDVVYNVHWIVTGTSDELNPEGVAYSATNIGMQILSVYDTTDFLATKFNEDTKAPSFIPFRDLINERVVMWTQKAMGEAQVASIEANIAQAIELLITPTSIRATIGEKPYTLPEKE